MAPTDPIPKEIEGYTVFPLTLPPLPSFTQTATHYLYLRPHEPKVPEPNAPRSLFLVNVPFDSTDLHMKTLFSVQIGLPQGRIEDVQLEGQRRKQTSKGLKGASIIKRAKKAKKRKRESEENIEDIEGLGLPPVWDRELLADSLTAVIVFVDRASMDAAFKAVKRMRKEHKSPIWGEGLEVKVPALGSARMKSILRSSINC